MSLRDDIVIQYDLSPSTWIGQMLQLWGGSKGTPIASLVPGIFAAYARILHPACGEGDAMVLWRTIADWSASIYHPQMQFQRISVLSNEKAWP